MWAPSREKKRGVLSNANSSLVNWLYIIIYCTYRSLVDSVLAY